MFKWIVFIAIGTVVVGSIWAGINNGTSPIPKVSPVATARPTIDKSPQMQADRKVLIEKLIAEGIFQKVEVPGSLPRLWVRPAFYQLEFDRKESFVSVVYAYYFDGSNDADSVRIFDSLSGTEVGAYAAVYGGLKMN